MMNRYLAFLPNNTWLLVLILISNNNGSFVASRCVPSPSLQQLLILQSYAVRVMVTDYLDDDGPGLGVRCVDTSDDSVPAIVTVLEVFKGSDLEPGSQFIMYWETDTGYRQIPSHYAHSSEGFLVFPQAMDFCVADDTIMRANECYSAGNMPWSDVAQEDVDRLYSRSDYQTDASLITSLVTTYGRDAFNNAFGVLNATGADLAALVANGTVANGTVGANVTNATTVSANLTAINTNLTDGNATSLHIDNATKNSNIFDSANPYGDNETNPAIMTDGNATSTIVGVTISAAAFPTAATILNLSSLLAVLTLIGLM